MTHSKEDLADPGTFLPGNLKWQDQQIANSIQAVLPAWDKQVWDDAGWREDAYPDSTGPCETTRNATPTLIANQAVWEFATMSAAECDEAWRQQNERAINDQVTNPTTQQVAADFRVNDQVIREQAAATDKLRESQEAADPSAVDTTLVVAAADDATVGYAQFAVNIDPDVEPWNGAPSDTTGGVFSLKITDAAEYAKGAEARVSVLDSPKGIDGPLPLVQDANDASLWTGPMSLGKYWNGDLGPVTAVLRWGSGSIIISSNLVSPGVDQRRSENVRYGI